MVPVFTFALDILYGARGPREPLFVDAALFLSKACETSGDSDLMILNDKEERDVFFELVSAVLDETEENMCERARLMDILTAVFGKVRARVLEEWAKETDMVEKTIARIAAACGGMRDGGGRRDGGGIVMIAGGENLSCEQEGERNVSITRSHR